MTQLSISEKGQRRRLTSVLGLALDGSRLEGVLLRRSNGSVQVQHSFSVALSLDPLTAAPELVGREIRNHLDTAGVREKCCTLGLPAKWVLTAHTEVPDIPDADVPSFLQIEAERAFPTDPAMLQMAFSVCVAGSGKKYALLAGIPKNHLTRMEQVLRTAKLKPVSFTLGLTALQPISSGEAEGVLAICIGEAEVGLEVTSAGGIVALRALEGALETEGSRRSLHTEAIGREARITVGQLPADLRGSVRRIRVFGPRDLAQHLADELELRCEPLGLSVELVTRYDSATAGLKVPADANVSPAFSLALETLAGGRAGLEFLPPHLTAWQQMATRYSSGKLRLAGAAAGVVLLMITGAFGYQQYELARLQREWNTLAPKVKDLKKVMQQIGQYRPWYDQNCRGLTLLRQLTEAFPEDGVVWAKTVEIRDLSVVSCTGQTRDHQALLKTLDKLRGTKGISDVRHGTTRGKSPMQFNFDFRWNEGGQS